MAPPPARPADPVRRLLPRALTDRTRGWVVTLSLTLIAGLVRLWNLGYPTDRGTPVFDEKHYVPQAWQMLRTGGLEDNAGYELVVHPPLGKQLIALGEAALGYDSWGWRLSAALAGTVCVLLVVRIARRMTRSTLLGGIAGVLLIADGLSHVQARMGMLDIFLAMFVLAAFGCLIIDREQVRERLATVVREGRAGDTESGPRFGVRWWRLGAGVLLGLSCGVKWSGVYYLVAFAVLSLVWDACARRTAGVRRPWAGTLARDLGPASWAMV
ncbi:MAG TPA: phospholipid carrier-dependent glycosyltransferase, partial [Pseudonocardiaceae bacterium]